MLERCGVDAEAGYVRRKTQHMAELMDAGVNAIRVYNVDPSINHDACASIFNTVRSYEETIG